ncbi:hypothetical protein [Aureimonas sp. N4]|uniref:hypothetical protein n=1 Tax=Aureimonas sp. N4 TaxID=1638165 RepID=UPI0012E37073|nr:hypothetical protein [Aureimonas sp. N4]
MRIFVAGLSKSGKSTNSRYAATIRGDIDHIGISKLLKARGGVLPVRTTLDAALNQIVATTALKSLQLIKPYQILDGHALIETEQGPFIVPDEFFTEIKPSLLIHIEERPGNLHQRRSRLGKHETPAELSALALMEKAACRRIAVRQGIPLIEMLSPTPDEFANSLGQQLAQFSARNPVGGR